MVFVVVVDKNQKSKAGKFTWNVYDRESHLAFPTYVYFAFLSPNVVSKCALDKFPQKSLS